MYSNTGHRSSLWGTGSTSATSSASGGKRSKSVTIDSGNLSAIQDCIRNLINIDTQERLDTTKKMLKEQLMKQKRDLDRRLANALKDGESSGSPRPRRQSRFLKRRQTNETIEEESEPAIAYASHVDTVKNTVDLQKSPSDQGFESGVDLSESDDPSLSLNDIKEDSILEEVQPECKLSAIPEEIATGPTTPSQLQVDETLVPSVNNEPSPVCDTESPQSSTAQADIQREVTPSGYSMPDIQLGVNFENEPAPMETGPYEGDASSKFKEQETAGQEIPVDVIPVEDAAVVSPSVEQPVSVPHPVDLPPVAHISGEKGLRSPPAVVSQFPEKTSPARDVSDDLRSAGSVPLLGQALQCENQASPTEKTPPPQPKFQTPSTVTLPQSNTEDDGRTDSLVNASARSKVPQTSHKEVPSLDRKPLFIQRNVCLRKAQRYAMATAAAVCQDRKPAKQASRISVQQPQKPAAPQKLDDQLPQRLPGPKLDEQKSPSAPKRDEEAKGGSGKLEETQNMEKMPQQQVQPVPKMETDGKPAAKPSLRKPVVQQQSTNKGNKAGQAAKQQTETETKIKIQPASSVRKVAMKKSEKCHQPKQEEIRDPAKSGKSADATTGTKRAIKVPSKDDPSKHPQMKKPEAKTRSVSGHPSLKPVNNEKAPVGAQKSNKKQPSSEPAKKPPIQPHRKTETKEPVSASEQVKHRRQSQSPRHPPLSGVTSRSTSRDGQEKQNLKTKKSGQLAIPNYQQPEQLNPARRSWTPRRLESAHQAEAKQEKTKFIHRKAPNKLPIPKSPSEEKTNSFTLKPLKNKVSLPKPVKSSSDLNSISLRPVPRAQQRASRSSSVDVGSVLRSQSGGRKWQPRWRRSEEEAEEDEAEAEEAPSQSEAVEEPEAAPPVEEEPPKEEEKPKPKPPPPRQMEEQGQTKTEAELAMLAQKRKHEEEEEAKLAHYEEQRRIQREKEEEELRLLKEKQERRKLEREEEERIMAERKQLEEERRRQEDEERKARAEADRLKKEADKQKRQALMAGLQASGGPNFEITKKDKQAEKFDKFGNIVKAKAEMGLTKEQQEDQKKKSLVDVCKPIDTSGMAVETLRAKIKDLHSRISRLEGVKYDLEKRRDRQEYDLKELNERQRQISRNKALKKGLDPDEVTNSPHPVGAFPHFPHVPPPSCEYYEPKPSKPRKPAIHHGSCRPPNEWGRKESEELENLRKNLEPPKYQEAVKVDGARPPMEPIPPSIEGDAAAVGEEEE